MPSLTPVDPAPPPLCRVRTLRAPRPLMVLVGTILSLAATTVARAEAPRFVAELDRNQVVVGESFVYQVTLGVGSDRVSDYRPPEFKGLRVLGTSGPNQSTQMQFGGAGMFVEVNYSWRYELSATQKGMVTITPARVKVNGQEFRTGTVTVSAANLGTTAPPPPISPPTAPAAPPASSAATAAPVPAPVAAPSRAGLPAEASNGGSFIRVVTDKQKVFVGEAISAIWYLYMNQAVDKFDPQTEPHTEGFWTEDLQVPSRRGALVQTEENVDGRPYQVAAVLKKALFPLQVGKLTITPMEARISRSDFFGNAVRGQQIRSGPTEIEVQPLPKAGQPAGFDAANVGTFTIAARVDRAQVAVGEAVTLTIEVSGRGNVRKLALPAVPKLEGWKSYDPRLTVTIDPATGVTGTKTAEILLLPERPGNVTIPPLVLNTFDPEGRRYAHVETAALPLTATGDGGMPGAVAAAAAGAPASDGFAENVIAGEIRPIHTSGGLSRDLGTTFFHTRGFVGLVAVPPIGLALMLLGLRMRDRLTEDTGARRRRHARRKVQAHLAAADAHRRKSEIGPFFIEIDRVMREALSARLGAPVKGLRMDELRSLLSGRGLAAADVDRLIALLEDCDRARFAPGSVDAAALGSTLEQAGELIDVVERMPLGEEGSA